MDNSEFINVFISKQKNLINELLAKNLIAETQLEIANNKLNALTEEFNGYKAEAEKAQKRSKSSE